MRPDLHTCKLSATHLGIPVHPLSIPAFAGDHRPCQVGASMYRMRRPGALASGNCGCLQGPKIARPALAPASRGLAPIG